MNRLFFIAITHIQKKEYDKFFKLVDVHGKYMFNFSDIIEYLAVNRISDDTFLDIVKRYKHFKYDYKRKGNLILILKVELGYNYINHKENEYFFKSILLLIKYNMIPFKYVLKELKEVDDNLVKSKFLSIVNNIIKLRKLKLV